MDDTFQIAARSSSMSDSLKNIQDRSAGEERLKADKRQFSGLMLALSICVTYFPLANLATFIGPNGTTPSSGLALAQLIAVCLLAFVGSLGMFFGYLGAVHDYNNTCFTKMLLVMIQLTWMPFVTDLYSVGEITKSGVGFIPEIYEPTETDVKFVGSMGMLGIVTYASAFVGSFAFMAFALSAYQDGKPTERNASYYKSRLTYYASGLALAGISQLFLGIYIMLQFGRIVFVPPIRVAVYTVTYSEITMAVGGIQLVMGFWGLSRRFGILVGGKSDYSYQICAYIMWLSMLGAQIMTQIGYQPGGDFAAVAPSYACLYLGIAIMSPYLDFKMRTTPEVFPAGYFGINTSELGSREDSRILSAQEAALRAYDSQVAPDVTYDEQAENEEDEQYTYPDNDDVDADFEDDFEDDVSSPSTRAMGGMNP